MARAFLAADNHAAARREAESALAADPDDMTMFLALDVIADVCWERDNWPAVIDIGERMLEIHPEGTLGFIQLGRGLMRAKHWRRCDEVLNAGMATNPFSAGLIQLMCERWRLARGYQTAEQWARKALELAPDNPYLLGQLVMVLVDRRKHAEATEVIAYMIEREPEGAHAYEVAAYAAYEANDYKRAAGFAALALERAPGSATAHMIFKRSRAFMSPLLWPLWKIGRLSPVVVLPLALAYVALFVTAPRVGGLAVVGLVLYLIAGGLAVSIIEHFHQGAPPRQDVQLKNY